MNNNKPISILYNEFRKKLTELLNENIGTLTPFLLHLALKDIYMEVSQLADKQLDHDKLSYEQQITETKMDTEHIKQEPIE